MELLKKEKQWFLSDEGGKKFAALISVGERAVFIYSYLKTFVSETFEKNNILFKTSFLLADAVINSNVPYSAYPDILSESHNPFIAFLANAKREYTIEQVYCIYLSIVHNIADPLKKSEWIYNDSLFKEDGYIHKMDELGHLFIVPNEDMFIDANAYKCEDKYNLIQLELIWLFGVKKGE